MRSTKDGSLAICVAPANQRCLMGYANVPGATQGEPAGQSRSRASLSSPQESSKGSQFL